MRSVWLDAFGDVAVTIRTANRAIVNMKITRNLSEQQRLLLFCRCIFNFVLLFCRKKVLLLRIMRLRHHCLPIRPYEEHHQRVVDNKVRNAFTIRAHSLFRFYQFPFQFRQQLIMFLIQKYFSDLNNRRT